MLDAHMAQAPTHTGLSTNMALVQVAIKVEVMAPFGILIFMHPVQAGCMVQVTPYNRLASEFCIL